MIYKRGKFYSYRFRFAGRMVHESARSTSKTLAREAERQRRRELEQNYNHVEKRKLPPTLKQAAALWQAKRTAVAQSTRDRDEYSLKALLPVLGSKLVCDIGADDVDYYKKMRAGLAGSTVNKELVCLGSIMGDHWQRIRRDVKRMTQNKDVGRAISLEEQGRLLESAARSGQRQGKWTPLYSVTVLALNTGMRHTELRRLRFRDLDLANRMLIVGESKTAAGTGRPIPLTQPAWATLSMWVSRFPQHRPDDYVFPACENGRIDPSRPVANWRTAWRNATSDAGLPILRGGADLRLVRQHRRADG